MTEPHAERAGSGLRSHVSIARRRFTSSGLGQTRADRIYCDVQQYGLLGLRVTLPCIAANSCGLRYLSSGCATLSCVHLHQRASALQVFGANEAVRLVMDVVDGGGSAAEAAQALVRQAVRRAMEGPDGDADNTTAVVSAREARCYQSGRFPGQCQGTSAKLWVSTPRR